MFFFRGLVRSSRKSVSELRLANNFATKMNLGTKIQHTDFSHHCKDLEGKEWHVFEFKA